MEQEKSCDDVSESCLSQAHYHEFLCLTGCSQNSANNIASLLQKCRKSAEFTMRFFRATDLDRRGHLGCNERCRDRAATTCNLLDFNGTDSPFLIL